MVRGVYHGQSESRYRLCLRQGWSGISRHNRKRADGARFLQYA